MFDHPLMPWLVLHHAPKLHHRGVHHLLKHFNHPSHIIRASASALREAGIREEAIQYLKRPNWAVLERECRWAEQPDCHIVTWGDEEYPSLLREIVGPPLLLYIRGEYRLLALPQLAMVGSRNPSFQGKETAEQFAADLVAAELVVVSGMAMGIDAASHQGALQAGGFTVAVLGSGLNCLYPRQNKTLAEQIAERGVLISEYPLQARAHAAYFPQRNRIISGLSLGVLVVEAARRSGSLITARLAAEQGREVFALPGSIHNPLSQGCHWLIQQGAKLVENANDIFEELPALVRHCLQSCHRKAKPPDMADLESDCQMLLECVGFERSSVDQLAYRSGMSVADVTAKLLILELNGYIRRSQGAIVRVV